MLGIFGGRSTESDSSKKMIEHLEKLGEVIKLLSSRVESLGTDIARLSTKMGDLSKSISRWVVCPAESMDMLTGELRALRYLLDKEDRFSFMDRGRASAEIKNVRKAAMPEPDGK